MKPVINFRNGQWFCVGFGVIGSGSSVAAAWLAMRSKVSAKGALLRATYQPRSAV